MPLYEVGIYNKIVRNFVRSGEDLPEHLDVKLKREFKPIDGYVVECVEKISD